MSNHKPLRLLLLLFACLALVLVACTAAEEGGEPGATEELDVDEPGVIEEGEDEVEVDEPAPDTEDIVEEDLQDLEGTVVSVFGPFVDEEQQLFEAAVQPFEERTGVDVQYEGSSEFETLILVRDEAGDPPDVAAVPQPGLMRDLAARGSLEPLPPEVVESVQGNYAPVWLDLGSFEDTPYGVFHRVNIKSLVFYRPEIFEQQGYAIPETWEELEALQQQMVADGFAPWCIGIEAGGGTGWVATDWVEDLMLRLHGPEVYDQWVEHEIPFNDPRVQEAVAMMGEIWLDPELVYGGTNNILTTPYGDAPNAMFEEPPQCLMHRQGNFITSFFPEEIQQNLDERVAIFGFPMVNPEFGIPMLGGGDQYIMFDDRPEVRAFLDYLATGESAVVWAQAGGGIFPHQDLPLDSYGTQIEQQMAELLQEAEVFRFDASDLMPGQVGAGTFWSGMVDYISGADLETVLQTIDESWPEAEE